MFYAELLSALGSTKGRVMKKLIILSVAISLTGCGTYLPQLTSDETLPLDVLIAKIDCEFQVAVWTQKTIGRFGGLFASEHHLVHRHVGSLGR